MRLFFSRLLLLTLGVANLTPAFSSDQHFEKTKHKFHGSYQKIPAKIAQHMLNRSWHPGCPVKRSALSYLTLTYWGFDNKPHIGHIIINKLLAKQTVDIFKNLYIKKFPIHRLNIYSHYPISAYGKADDSVGFYCRPMDDTKPPRWSKHSYGIAIDINPVENPSIEHKGVWPANAKQFKNRTNIRKGMIKAHDVVFKSFTQKGWVWGGWFVDEKDYMHFQKLMNEKYMATELKVIPKPYRMPGLS